VVGLDRGAGDAVGTAYRTQALLALGAQVQVVLVELAQQVEAVRPQAFLALGVGEPSRLDILEEADDVRVAAVRGREGAGQLRRPSWATSVSSPALASASSFWRARR
jgi:hypothetical protein